jgi:putative tricarboxylic transport membrane protein
MRSGFMAMSDRIFAFVWLGVCTLIVVQMLTLSVPFAYEPVGPKAFPILLALLMAVCCAVLFVNPDSDIRWPAVGLLGKGILLIGVLLGYAELFEVLGFPVATATMVFVVNSLFGGRWWSGLTAAVLLGVGGYLLFDQLLEVSLPVGQTWPWA